MSKHCVSVADNNCTAPAGFGNGSGSAALPGVPASELLTCAACAERVCASCAVRVEHKVFCSIEHLVEANA